MAPTPTQLPPTPVAVPAPTPTPAPTPAASNQPKQPQPEAETEAETETEEESEPEQPQQESVEEVADKEEPQAQAEQQVEVVEESASPSNASAEEDKHAALKKDPTPHPHPAACVREGEEAPTEEELARYPVPQHPPDGCSHMLNAWRNYVWCHRTRPNGEGAGKDEYTPEQVEVHFAYFCENLKKHEVQAQNRDRLTVKQADNTYKEINEEKLQWNEYYDYPDLKDLRGFRYSIPFLAAQSHEQWIAREYVKVSKPQITAPTAVDGQGPVKKDVVKIIREAIQGTTQEDEAETKTQPKQPIDVTAPSPFEQQEQQQQHPASLLETVARAEPFLIAPVSSSPISARTRTSADPLVPDFDFTLNPNLVPDPIRPGHCGANYAFATVQLMYMTYAVQCSPWPHNQTAAEMGLEALSAQQMVSCSGRGCGRGDVVDALKFAQRQPIRTEEAYPMTPQTFASERGGTTAPQCKNDPAVAASAAKPMLASFGHPIPPCKERSNDPYDLCLRQDESELAKFVAKQPVSAVIDGNDQVFSALYSGYIVRHTDCSSMSGAGDMAVTIVGLLTDAKTGRKVWKVQANYGEDWGDKGYAYLEYGFNTCGIANYNHYVQSTCERPVGPNPPPRPAIPSLAPQPVAPPSPTEYIPGQPVVKPTVPVIPIPRDSVASGEKPNPYWWLKPQWPIGGNLVRAARQAVKNGSAQSQSAKPAQGALQPTA